QRVREQPRGDGEADLASEERRGGVEGAVRRSGHGRLPGAPRGRPPGAVPAVQRRLPRLVVRVGRACRALSGGYAPYGAPARPPPRRHAGYTRAVRAHVPACGASPGPRRCVRRATLTVRPGSFAMGRTPRRRRRATTRPLGVRPRADGISCG